MFVLRKSTVGLPLNPNRSLLTPLTFSNGKLSVPRPFIFLFSLPLSLGLLTAVMWCRTCQCNTHPVRSGEPAEALRRLHPVRWSPKICTSRKTGGGKYRPTFLPSLSFHRQQSLTPTLPPRTSPQLRETPFYLSCPENVLRSRPSPVRLVANVSSVNVACS